MFVFDLLSGKEGQMGLQGPQGVPGERGEYRIVYLKYTLKLPFSLQIGIQFIEPMCESHINLYFHNQRHPFENPIRPINMTTGDKSKSSRNFNKRQALITFAHRTERGGMETHLTMGDVAAVANESTKLVSG